MYRQPPPRPGYYPAGQAQGQYCEDYARDSSRGYEQDLGQHQPPVNNVRLDEYNSDLNFVIERDGVIGSSLHDRGFEYMWAGARATHGVRSGKVCFEVTVLEKLPVSMPESEKTPHVVRVGWSPDFSNLQVGEDTLSYGYGGTGKCSVNNKFFDYGEAYSTNDVITCYIDLDASPKCVFFAKNGKYLGVAFRLGPEAHDVGFFPHVTVKNMKLRINFGAQDPYFPPVQEFPMIQNIATVAMVPASGAPASKRDCHAIMMVGIPGAGKTVWAVKYAKEHPEKKYNILGTNTVMDKMKVMGLMRRRNYHGRWDMLIKQATDVLNKVLKIAEQKSRNYILDQTNVYPNARRRKMNSFRGFYRIAAVIVNTNAVLKERTEKREKEEGKIVPECAVMEMKANFTLPEVGEVFDDVWFLEENKESSQRLVEEYCHEGLAFKDAEKKRKEDGNIGTPSGSSSDTVHKRQRVDHVPQEGTPSRNYGQGGYNRNDHPGGQGSAMPARPQGASSGSYGAFNPRGGSAPGTYGPPPSHSGSIYGGPHRDYLPHSEQLSSPVQETAPPQYGSSCNTQPSYGSTGQGFYNDNIPSQGWKRGYEQGGTGGGYGTDSYGLQDSYRQGYQTLSYAMAQQLPRDHGLQDYNTPRYNEQGYSTQGHGYSSQPPASRQPYGSSGVNTRPGYASQNSGSHGY